MLCVGARTSVIHIAVSSLLSSLNVEFFGYLRDQRPQFKFCIICGQIKGNERLAENPTSHDRVLTWIQEWASYGHLEYFESRSKLKTFTALKLKDKRASWHRVCSSGIRTPYIETYIAIARSLYGNVQASERELARPLIKQDKRFQKWHQRKYRCS